MNPLVNGQTPMPGAGGAPQGAASVTPDQIAQAHQHTSDYVNALTQLVQMPHLTKQDVFKAAADLIAKGLFSDPQSRMAMISELTQLPDDENALRQVLGQQMMHAAQFTDAMSQAGYGPGGAGG